MAPDALAVGKLEELEALTSQLPNEAQRDSLLRSLRRWKAEVVAQRASAE